MPNNIPLGLENQIQGYEKSVFTPGLTRDYVSLEVEVLKYFDEWWDNPSKVDALFTRFAATWRIYYELRDFSNADKFWDLPLEYATRWEENHQKHLHKATAYYFRAMAAVAAGNIDRGFLFFHQALDEDEKIPAQKGWGPAWSFVNFDYSNPRQAARQLLTSRANWLDGIISKYQNSGRGSLSLETLRNRVLNNLRLRETTFSFTHAVFRSENLLSLPDGFRSSTFASQIALDILFTLCRIGEVWLKDRQPPNGRSEYQLGGQLIRFFNSQSSNLEQTDLTQINRVGFEVCLDALLNDRQDPLPKHFQLWESDLILIYILRNKAGHTVTSSPVISERFKDLMERVLFGMFNIAETLF